MAVQHLVSYPEKRKRKSQRAQKPFALSRFAVLLKLEESHLCFEPSGEISRALATLSFFCSKKSLGDAQSGLAKQKGVDSLNRDCVDKKHSAARDTQWNLPVDAFRQTLIAFSFEQP